MKEAENRIREEASWGIQLKVHHWSKSHRMLPSSLVLSHLCCLFVYTMSSFSPSSIIVCLPVYTLSSCSPPASRSSSLPQKLFFSDERGRYEGRRWKETQRVKKKGSEKGSQWCPSLFIPASLKPNGDSSDRSSRLTFGWDSSCLHSMKGLHYNEDS